MPAWQYVIVLDLLKFIEFTTIFFKSPDLFSPPSPLIGNFTQPRVVCKGSLNGECDRSDWPVGVSVGVYLDCF